MNLFYIVKALFMNIIFFLLIMSTATDQTIIFDFNSAAKLKNWYTIDDDVMGGRSNGNITINEEGHGVFEGRISLENNGGFSSIQYSFNKINVSPNDKIVIRLKGDGKAYQFRVRESRKTYYSYIQKFDTSGEWENIKVSLNDMFPSWRGRRLNAPNFDHDQIEEITFLIGNKREENFKLLIDRIDIHHSQL